MIQLQTIELLPKFKQLYSVLWMHGLGADGNDFKSIVSELNLPAEHGIGFIFPNAPIQPVTINNGMKMRSWYDILETSFTCQIDEAGIIKSSSAIAKLIQKEMNKGIDSKNILLAGFSQGGVIALHTGLRFNKKLAGILALSTYLPASLKIKSEYTQENQSIPIFMAHGSMDSVIDIHTAKLAFNRLKSLRHSISWHEYHMQHSICADEIKDIAKFIKTVLLKTDN